MIRKLAAVALATSVVSVAGTAAAQETETETTRGTVYRPMGLRFETAFERDFNIATVNTSAVQAPNITATSQSGFSPNGDIKIGYDLPMGFTPMIGFGLLTRNRAQGEDSVTNTLIVLDVEARWYFKPHRGNALQPFVFGEFNTALVSFGADPSPSNEEQDALDALGAASDYTEINAGLGMEYKFDGAQFAIGGKWGLGFAFTGITTDNLKKVDPTAKDGIGDTTIGTSTAIYAAWRI